MNPKDGTACKAEAPVEPAEPKEATSADPGESSKTSGSEEPEERSSDARGGSGFEKESSKEKKEVEITWVEIELKDKKGNPVPNEDYEVKLADGSVRKGKLGPDGKARLAGVKPGSCDVKFPKVDKKEWKKA